MSIYPLGCEKYYFYSSWPLSYGTLKILYSDSNTNM